MKIAKCDTKLINLIIDNKITKTYHNVFYEKITLF